MSQPSAQPLRILPSYLASSRCLVFWEHSFNYLLALQFSRSRSSEAGIVLKFKSIVDRKI